MNSAQRQQLHEAIVGYLTGQIGENATRSVAAALNVDSVPADMKGRLEAKWKALVYLQGRIRSLEGELVQAKEAAASAANGGGVIKRSKGLPSQVPVQTFDENQHSVNCVALHPRWNVVAAGFDDGQIKLWNLETGDREHTLKAHTRSVTGLDLGDGLLVSCSNDLTVRMFRLERNYEAHSFVGHEHTVSAVKLFANDEKIASCSRDCTIRIWDVDSGYCSQVIKAHTDWVRTLSVYDGGVISAGRDQVVRLTPFGAGAKSVALLGHQHVIECSAIAPKSAHEHLDKIAGSPSQLYFATGARDKTIIIWSGRQQVAVLSGHDNWVRAVYFHPQGRFLLSASDDKTIRIWDLENEARLHKTVIAHDHFVSCMVGDERYCVSGSVDKTVKVW